MNKRFSSAQPTTVTAGNEKPAVTKCSQQLAKKDEIELFGIFVCAAEMVDLRVDGFGVESFTATRQHKENSRCCLCEEDHREDAQGVEYVPTENGFVERVRVVGCRKVEGFGLPLNAGALAWFGTLPHLTLCACPKRVTRSDKPPSVLCHRPVRIR